MARKKQSHATPLSSFLFSLCILESYADGAELPYYSVGDALSYCGELRAQAAAIIGLDSKVRRRLMRRISEAERIVRLRFSNTGTRRAMQVITWSDHQGL